ncbi:MAG: insulinase family protein [Cellvibrio sp.]|nr:insulinase family protein [Cellvibrio sp.]
MSINRIFIKIAVLAIAIVATSCAKVQPVNLVAMKPDPIIIKSPNDDRQYSSMVLPNGLQVVLISDPTLEISAASLAVGVGSAQDPKNQMGLAHYLEHMLFLGTEKFPEPSGFMKFTQANGGMTNAFTAYNRTNYRFQINATKYDEALDRFSDYFKKPTFDPKYSDKERNAVNNEWSLQKAQDNWNLFALQGITANPESPASQFNIGNLDTLKDKPDSVLIDEMKQFYQRYYSANIMKLSLVGKQSLPELRALAEKHFASIPNKNISLPEVTVSGITKAQMGKTIHYKPLRDMKLLYIDFPIRSNLHQWRLKPNEFIHNLLTSEEPGTLGEQMRAKGWVKEITANFESDAYGPDGYCRVYAELTDDGLNKQDEIVAAIFAYIDLIKQKGLNENYYTELQSMRAKDFVNAPKPNPLQQAVGLSMSQFELPVENLMNSHYVYERYDAKSIKNVLSQLQEKRARIWYVNSGEKVDTPIPFFDGQYALDDISADQYRRWEKLKKDFAFNLPPLNNLFSNESAEIVKAENLKPKLVVAQEGVEAFLVHPEFYAEDKGKIALQLNVDFALDSPKQAVLAQLLNGVFAKQTMTLADRASRASLSVSTSVMDVNSQGIYISGYTSKHAQLLEQMLNEFSALNMDEQYFSEALDTYKNNLANQKKNHVFRQLFAHMQRLQYRQQWSDDELLAVANQVTHAELVAYHQAVKANLLLRFLFAGNYTEAQVREMTNKATAILPGKKMPQSRSVNSYVTPAAGKIVEIKQEVELADSAVLQAWFGNQKSDDEQAQLVVLNALFGNAFFTQLRTNEQLGYVVTSFDFPVDEVPGFGMLVQSSNTDLTGIKARMDKPRSDYLPTLKATDDAIIEQTKQAMIANLLQKPTDIYADTGRYAREFWHAKYQFDGRDRYLASLKKVTKQDLINIYEKLLLNDKAGQYLLQIRGTNFKDKPFASVK